jgi:hypothetical protein
MPIAVIQAFVAGKRKGPVLAINLDNLHLPQTCWSIRLIGAPAQRACSFVAEKLLWIWPT